MVCWAGCSKPTSTNVTTEGWVWESEPGKTVPALSIPWAPKNGWNPAQPDNNGGDANQCVYEGNNGGLSDENADSFANQINIVQCECGMLRKLLQYFVAKHRLRILGWNWELNHVLWSAWSRKHARAIALTGQTHEDIPHPVLGRAGGWGEEDVPRPEIFW